MLFGVFNEKLGFKNEERWAPDESLISACLITTGT
jgi:hypothetical protein